MCTFSMFTVKYFKFQDTISMAFMTEMAGTSFHENWLKLTGTTVGFTFSMKETYDLANKWL